MDKEAKNNLEEGFKKLFSSSIILKKQKYNKVNKKKSIFLTLIKEYNEALEKSLNLSNQFKIDLYEYEEIYFNVIDKLMILLWGDEVYDIINYYLYDRVSLDGTSSSFYEKQQNGDELEITLKTPEDLYNYLIQRYPDFLN
jgi:hypothetical protein